MEVAEPKYNKYCGGASKNESSENKAEDPIKHAIDKIIELYKQAKDIIPHIPKALTSENIDTNSFGNINSFQVIYNHYFANEKNERYKEFNECAARGIDLIYKHNPGYDFFKKLSSYLGGGQSEVSVATHSDSQQNTKKYTPAEIEKHFEKYYMKDCLFCILGRHSKLKKKQNYDTDNVIKEINEAIGRVNNRKKKNIEKIRSYGEILLEKKDHAGEILLEKKDHAGKFLSEKKDQVRNFFRRKTTKVAPVSNENQSSKGGKKTHKKIKKNKRKTNARRNKRTKNYTRKKR